MGQAAAEMTWRLTAKPWRHHLYHRIMTTLFTSDVESIPGRSSSATAPGSTPKKKKN
jgi:hypothetical protein